MRQWYNRSICSTCSFLSFCVMTTDKSNITSCSEYEHYMDSKQKEIAIEPGQIRATISRTKTKRHLVLN